MGEDRAKFQDIVDFLKALATGVAEGNKALEDVQEATASKFGALVVKEGEISAQFEISSLAMKEGLEAPQLGLGVRTVKPLLPVFPVPLLVPFANIGGTDQSGNPQNPFLGMVSQSDRAVSEAKITLKLVRIAPMPKEPPFEKRVLEPNLTILEPDRPIGPINTGPQRPERHGEPIPSTRPSSGASEDPKAEASPVTTPSEPPAKPAQPTRTTTTHPARPTRGSGQSATAGSQSRASRSVEGRRQAPTRSESSEATIPPQMRQAAAAALQEALATLSAQIPFIPVSERQRRSIIADIDRVGALLEQGDIEGATQEFADFAQRYGAIFGTT